VGGTCLNTRVDKGDKRMKLASFVGQSGARTTRDRVDSTPGHVTVRPATCVWCGDDAIEASPKVVVDIRAEAVFESWACSSCGETTTMPVPLSAYYRLRVTGGSFPSADND